MPRTTTPAESADEAPEGGTLTIAAEQEPECLDEPVSALGV